MARQTYIDAVFSSVLWTSLDRVTSLLKHVFIASAVGLSVELDVFYMTVGLVSLLVFSWSRIADVIAVPKLVELTQKGHSSEARHLTGDLFTLSTLFTGVLGCTVVLGWPWFTRLAWGFDEERRSLLNEAVLWVLPLLFFYVPLRMLYSFAKARREFYISYQNEFFISLTMLACVIIFPNSQGVLLWSYGLGVTGAFALAIASSWKKINFRGIPWSPSVRSLTPMIPAMLLLFAAQYLYSLVDRQMVSFLPQGAVSAVAYGWTITLLFPALLRLDSPFITVYSEHTGKQTTRDEKLNQLISASLTVGTLMTGLLFAFSREIIGLLLERGHFTHENTLMVAGCTAYFAFSIIPIMLIGPLGQVFQVEKRLGLIVKRVVFGVVLNFLFTFLFIFIFNWGANGAALGTSISQWGMLIASAASIRQLGVTIHFRRHLRWMLSIVSFSLVSVAITQILQSHTFSRWALIPEVLLFLLMATLPIWVGRSQDSRLAQTLVSQIINKLVLRFS